MGSNSGLAAHDANAASASASTNAIANLTTNQVSQGLTTAQFTALTTAQIAINSTYDVYRQVGSDVPITLPTGNVTELVSTFRLPVNSIGAPVDLSGNDVTVTVSFDLTVGPAASQADAYAIGQVTWAASGIAEQFGQARTLLRETLFIGASKTINCQMVQRFRMPSTGVAPTWEFYLRAGCKSVVPAAISTPEWGVEILKV